VDEITRAADILRRGGLVAFPTETVYGLGADAADPAALGRLYEVKRRPPDHPVIVHIADPVRLRYFARDLDPLADKLAAAFWPGPLTLVVRRNPDRVAPEATGGRDTVGLRVPNHPLALALLDAFDGGIAAPSANRFGRVSPTTAAHVQSDLNGDVDLILDGGPSRVGVESTIVDLSGTKPFVLRVGGIDEARLADVAGVPVKRRTAGEVAAPGTLAVHYAPHARVEIVDASDVARRAAELRPQRVGVLAPDPPPLVTDVTVLPPPATVDEYARVLYSRLREADEVALDVLLVVPPPDEGLGTAIRDRLERAAAG
jgi:L-threonylcarbamoyladenylate synthase